MVKSTSVATSGRRRVQVSKSTVAAARARVTIANKLGKPISPATAKIAKIAK